MKAAVLEKLGSPMTVDDISVSNPIGKEVLVEVRANGLCHSDLALSQYDFGLPLPAVFGHEVGGVVRGLGPDVTTLEIGDHVVACLVGSCGHCDQCITGRPQFCRNGGFTARPKECGSRLHRHGQAIYQGGGIGGLGETALIHEANLVKIRKDMPLEKACVMGCAVVTGAGAAINTAQIRVGHTVAVVGCGGVGLNVIQGARLAGAVRIIAIDVVQSKLDLALKFGATDLVDASTSDPVAQVRQITGAAGVDAAFEVVGTDTTILQAMGMVGNGGMAYIVGMTKPGTVLHLGGPELLMRRIGVQKVYMGSTNFKIDIPRYVEYYLQGRLNLDDLISRRISIDEVNAGFDAMTNGEVARSVVVY